MRTATGALEIRGATTHNLRDLDVDIPLGLLVVVTGVAGSGKTSLIHGSMVDGPVGAEAGVVSIDQTGIRGSRRSNPATYTKLLDPIRKAFAKANGVKPALFSANSDGACPTCNGAGVIYTDLAVMATIATICEECGGKRFDASVLDYHLGGQDISEVLAMSVDEALAFFADGEAHLPAAHKILDRLSDVGLGYLTIGQPLTTLSGGERQRLKLATHMGERGGIYVLDEPTVGLHLADVAAAARSARSPRRLGQVGHRHRAPPSGDGARGLDHRPRPGRRPGRRQHRVRGHPRRPRRRPRHAHGRAPRRVRRRLTRRGARATGGFDHSAARPRLVLRRRRASAPRTEPMPDVDLTYDLSERDWVARWIAPGRGGRPAGPAATGPPARRSGAGSTARSTSARLYATAHGVYEAFVNGTRVGDVELTPGWTAYRSRLQVQTYDVTDLLRPGDNVIGALLSDGWWRGQNSVSRRVDDYGTTTALLAAARRDAARPVRRSRSAPTRPGGRRRATSCGPT